jgi:hypothetical protein
MAVPETMNWVWWGAPLIVAALGALWLITGIGRLFTGKLFSASRGLLGGAALTSAGLAASLLGLNLQTYSRLSYERPVAMVTVNAVDTAQKLYNVKITRLDGSNREQSCEIQGDEWILGGRVQKWQAWANVLGLDATYDLDQVANKYFSAGEANGKPITACDLVGDEPAVNQYVPPQWTSWLLSLVQVSDRKFGSANYMPLADGAQYRVVMTQSGLNSEPANTIAQAAYDAPH